MAHRWSGRRSVLAVLISLPLAGGVAGAATAPAPEFPFRATAVMTAGAGLFDSRAAGAVADRAGALADLAGSDAFLTSVQGATPGLALRNDDLRELISVRHATGSALVEITARGRNQPAAVLLANTAAAEAIDLQRRLQSGSLEGALVVADFEQGGYGWAIFGPDLDHQGSLTRSFGAARYGSAFLTASCPSEAACGMGRDLYFPFQRAATYTVSGWVRTKRRTSVNVRVVGGPDDRAAAKDPAVSRSWKRASVTWTPAADHEVARVLFTADQGSPLELDGVFLHEADRPPDPSVEERAIVTSPAGGLLPAQPTSRISSSTASAVALGTGGGLLVALGAVGGGFAARRRRNQSKGNPDPELKAVP